MSAYEPSAWSAEQRPIVWLSLGRDRRAAKRRPAPRLGRTGRNASIAVILAALFLGLMARECALAAAPEVVLLRGWFGVFSTGLDKLADELKAQGIPAEVSGHLQWSKAVAQIIEERRAGENRPLVLIGHSQGANNIIDMARSLAAHNIPVELLVTLAPYRQNAVPANVARALNYYSAGGWGAPLEPDAGFHGKITNNNVADDPLVLHITIDKSAKIHTEILREIAALAVRK
jgi:hypothetical protein